MNFLFVTGIKVKNRCQMMENSVTKRKDSCMDCDSITLKKARYSWQVKRSNREDISSVTDVVICDNVSSCQHCNARGEKSACDCQMKIISNTDQVGKYLDRNTETDRDMDCTASNVPLSICAKNESQIFSNQSQVKNSETTEHDRLGAGNSIVYFQNPVTPSLSTSECFNSVHNFSRTSSPASSSVNLSFDLQDQSDMQKDDGRTSVSSFTNTTSMLALPSNGSVDPEIEEEGLLISHRQREEELNLYLKRWQNQHIAKSIVDNAINKTLEEMGVSPEPQQFVSNLIENHGISEAIRLQGLIPQTQCNHMGPVNVLSDLAHSSSYFLPLSDRPKSQASTEQNDNATDASTTSSELLDHAVSVAIGSKGLTFSGQGT